MIRLWNSGLPTRLNIFSGGTKQPMASLKQLSRLRFELVELCMRDSNPWSNPVFRQNSHCFKPSSARRAFTKSAIGVSARALRLLLEVRDNLLLPVAASLLGPVEEHEFV